MAFNEAQLKAFSYYLQELYSFIGLVSPVPAATLETCANVYLQQQQQQRDVCDEDDDACCIISSDQRRARRAGTAGGRVGV
jgi:hypothetical protein